MDGGISLTTVTSLTVDFPNSKYGKEYFLPISQGNLTK